MVVHTASDKVKQARSAMMEFFLINHPLDCPICDQAGECRLQEYAVEHGTGTSRYTEPKLALSKAVDIGAHVTLDQERCIQCSRCIRFCDEVTKTGELGFFERGERSQIGIFPGKRLDNAYSGNVVDLCPVGALTLKEFRFKTRVWYLKNTPTICAGCARGCNVVVSCGQQQAMMTTSGQLDDRVKRIVPRVNDEVNGHWICDEGRLSYEREQRAERLRAPRIGPAAATYDAAIASAAAKLAGAARAGTLGVIASPRTLCEDLFAWHELVAALGGAVFGVRSLVEGRDDDLLVRADKGANARGAAWIFGAASRRGRRHRGDREGIGHDPARSGRHARSAGLARAPAGVFGPGRGGVRRPVRVGRFGRRGRRDSFGVVVGSRRDVREFRRTGAARASLPPPLGRGPPRMAHRGRRGRGLPARPSPRGATLPTCSTRSPPPSASLRA